MKQLKVFMGILTSVTVCVVLLYSSHLQLAWYTRLSTLSQSDVLTGTPLSTNLQHPQEPMTFVKQNVTEILVKAKTLFKPYLEDIKQATEEFRKSNKGWIDHGKTKMVFRAYDKGFFEQVQALPSVKTIFAKVDCDKLIEVMNTSHYYYGSSDCVALEDKRGIYANYWGKIAFNDTCHNDFSSYKDLLPVNLNYLMIGLPASFSLQYPQVAMTFMHVVANAVVVSFGDVFVDQARLYIQRCKAYTGRPKVGNLTLHGELFTIAQFWGDGFFHFTVEDLIRISPYLQFLQENEHIKVHVAKKNSFTKCWLNALGISPDRLVSGSVRVSLLYLPAGTPCGRPTYMSSQLLSMNLRQSLGLTKGPRDVVVVIKRSTKRYFKKHNEIWQMAVDVATKLGFQVKLFSDRHLPTLQETAEMFQRAVVILGPHGAGLSNMLLSQSGTVILEGLCSPVNLCYRNLAKMLGHRYVGLIFKHSCFNLAADDIKPYLQYFLQEFSKGVMKVID